ncbi:MAG: ATP-binding cassette domain-containing protein, partial [Verrucomicrobiota bacterium]
SVVFSRGEKRILDGVSLRVAPGELTVVLGPNGAGKSTLLDVLSGWLSADSGEVMLDGQPIQKFSPLERARRCAVMRQDSVRPAGLTVLESVELGRMALGGTAAEIRDTACDMLRRMDLADLESRDCASLSGGEWQRAAFARTAAQVWNSENPAAVLLDEPVSSLDPSHQHALLAEAQALAEQGHGVLAILHDLNLAARHADTVVLLCSGRIEETGPAGEVLQPEILSRIFECPVTVLEDSARGLRALLSLPRT